MPCLLAAVIGGLAGVSFLADAVVPEAPVVLLFAFADRCAVASAADPVVLFVGAFVPVPDFV